MDPIHQCQLCKEAIEITKNNPNLSVLEHLSAVHGIVVPAPPWAKDYTGEKKEETEKLTAYLEKIRGTKINN